MFPPPVLPPGKCTIHSPPGFSSTFEFGASQLLNPSLVANAFHTSALGAGTVISTRSIFSDAFALAATAADAACGVMSRCAAAAAVTTAAARKNERI
jgi:hypothetical protein